MIRTFRIRLESIEPLPSIKCWYEVDTSLLKIHQLCLKIRKDFNLTHPITLELDGFDLLPNGSIQGLLRENDLICCKVLLNSDSNLLGKRSAEENLSKEKDVKVVKLHSLSEFDSPSKEFNTIKSVNVSKKDENVCESESSESSESSLSTITDKEKQDSSSSSDSSEASDSSSSESDSEDSVIEEKNQKIKTQKDILHPPLSLAGRNKRKLMQQMFKKSVPVHQRFEEVQEKNESLEKGSNVFYSQVYLYDEPRLNLPFKQGKKPSGNPCDSQETQEIKETPQETQETAKLSASQKRRMRRKLAKSNSTHSNIPSISMKEPNTTLSIEKYESLPECQGIPKQGSEIAFKILELNQQYQPVISDYKEATVIAVDSTRGLVTLKHKHHSTKKSNSSESNSLEIDNEIQLRKFELPFDEEIVTLDSQETDISTYEVSNLIQTKLINI